MIPIVEPDAKQKGKRKGKNRRGERRRFRSRTPREVARRSEPAHAKAGGGGIQGGVEAAGQQHFGCTVRAGFGAGSHVHAVGDGAPWIVRQIEDRFGEQAPVRVCHRYLGARKDHLNYREAIAEGLPIGSGEIESAHRSIAQKCLKLPGAWWLVYHAEYMLALRINRLNGDWEAYWAGTAAKPARTRQSQPAWGITSARRLIAQLWFAPASLSSQ